MNSKKQEKLLVKELQKFFNKIVQLMLVQKNTIAAPIKDMPALFLIMKEEDFKNAKHYNINKTIADLLDNKYPVLHIKVDEGNLKVEYSIKDEESGLHFKLKTQDATQPFADFLKATHYTEKIPMLLMGLKADDSFAFEEDVTKNILLFIDGYFIEP